MLHQHVEIPYMTHAKAKFLRRISNRNSNRLGCQSMVSGHPIPGNLTPTEIAKKQRRAERRPEILKRKEADALTEELRCVERQHSLEQALKASEQFTGKEIDKERGKIAEEIRQLGHLIFLAREKSNAVNGSLKRINARAA